MRTLARLLPLAALLLAGCVPLPVRLAPGVSGVVVDARSGAPLPGAVVVVRFEGSYDEVLPEREPLGHREAVADAAGRFRTPALVSRGMTAWPWLRVRARVVAAWAPEHRCASDALVTGPAPLRIALAPTADLADQRESCRAVGAPFAEIPRYTRLWRGLHAPASGARELAGRSPGPALARSLEARALLGFGANCRGPVVDVSLAPGGERAALLVRDGAELEVQLVALAPAPAPAEVLLRASAEPRRRLAWSPAGELFLIDADDSLEALASGALSDARETTRQRLWQPPGLPAAPAPWAGAWVSGAGDVTRNDEASTRFGGRAFEMLHDLDPQTGLARDQLRVSEPTGEVRLLDLPGEACRQSGRFGRPHYRLGHDGRWGLDLRFVEGRCQAVAIDLASGGWRGLQAGSGGEPVCARSRRLPRAQLGLALRGYVVELENRLSESGLDPFAAFSLELGAGGRTVIRAVDAAGVARRLAAPAFPITTPLERIEVSVVAPPPSGTPSSGVLGAGAPPPSQPSVDAAPTGGWDPL